MYVYNAVWIRLSAYNIRQGAANPRSLGARNVKLQSSMNFSIQQWPAILTKPEWIALIRRLQLAIHAYSKIHISEHWVA